MRLCLIEDDTMLGHSVQTGLRSYGFTVDWVRNGDDAQNALLASQYWTVLLDLSLPGKQGLGILADLRAKGDDTPVIILSARDAVTDRIAGLDGGADDYLAKPFDLNELIARIRAVRRRREGRSSAIVEYGRIRFDTNRQLLQYCGEPVALRSRELAFLTALLEEPGKILSREQLIDRIYGWRTEIESNAVEFHIHALRRKLSPGAIRTIRGIGYLLVDENDDS